MDHLSVEQIKAEILEYVGVHSYNFALLIDGEWGCGKTHFVRNVLIPAIEKAEYRVQRKNNQETNNKQELNTKRVLYISLYGVNSTEDIAQQILHALVERRTGIKGKWVSGLRASAEIIDKLFSSNEGVSGKIAEASIQFTSDWANDVLIFDDLERTNLPINEVFGYINQFVEQNETKVILIANEREIGKVDCKMKMDT